MKPKMKIYLYCVVTGQGSGAVKGSSVGGDVIGYALAENGEGLCSHYSSNEHYSKHDMGLTSKWKHDIYEKAYPQGFELIWVDDPDNSKELKEAYALNQAIKAQEEKNE